MKRRPREGAARSERRATERAAEKVSDARERLWQLEPGGNANRPLDISSPSVVEVHALGQACPRCGGPHEVLEHAAVLLGGVRLREARLRCRQCGTRRSRWYRIVPEAVN